MMMALEKDYTKLTVRELKRLITLGDNKALDEHLRRTKSGEIKMKRYTMEDLDRMIAENQKKAS